MMKAMLTQPMAGKTDEEIIATREKAIKALQEKGYQRKGNQSITGKGIRDCKYPVYR